MKEFPLAQRQIKATNKNTAPLQGRWVALCQIASNTPFMLGTFHGLKPKKKETAAEDTAPDWRKTSSMGYFLFISPKAIYLKYKSARLKPFKASLSPQSIIQACQHSRLASHSSCCYSGPLSTLFTLHFILHLHKIAYNIPLSVLSSSASVLIVNTLGSNTGARSPNVGKMRCERMVTSQVSRESLGSAGKWRSLASCRKEFKNEPQ